MFLKLGDSWTNYPLLFHELDSKESELIFEDEKVLVRTIPLNHRIYTNGFLFEEKLAPRVLDVEAVAKCGIDKSQFRNIKNGKDGITEDEKVIPNAELTLAPPKPKSYAFCSDTAYKEDIVPLIEKVDLLYHESTFLEKEQRLCAKTKHSTAAEAATIAKKANVGKLLLGHYSTRYKSLELFKEEAETVFKNVDIAEDGKVFKL